MKVKEPEIYIYDDIQVRTSFDAYVLAWDTCQPEDKENYRNYKYQTFIDRRFFKEQGFWEDNLKLKFFLRELLDKKPN